jgi:hypothetical protein
VELEYLSKGKQLIVRYRLPNREVISKEARFQYIRKQPDGSVLVAAWSSFTGTHRGDLYGYPATGRRVTVHGYRFFRFFRVEDDLHYRLLAAVGLAWPVRAARL